MNYYYYCLYNLKIRSNIPIIELKSIEGNYSYDLEIQAEPLPPSQHFLENQVIISKNHLYMSVRDIGVYEVKGDKLITLQYHPSASPEEISLFLLGSCMGIVLMIRGFLPLHASAIDTKHGAVLFTGESGAGKSTTLKAFLQRGYQMLADDVSAINTKGEVLVYPSFPRTKIWQDSADKLSLDTAGLKRIKRDMAKYSHPVTDNAFQTGTRQPFTIYEINKYDGSQVVIEEINGFDKITLLHDNTYRLKSLEKLQKKKEHFQQIATLAKVIKVKKVFRPAERNSIDELVKILEEDFS